MSEEEIIVSEEYLRKCAELEVKRLERELAECKRELRASEKFREHARLRCVRLDKIISMLLDKMIDQEEDYV